MENQIQFHQKSASEDEWIAGIATTLWGSVEIISKEHVYDLRKLPTIVAQLDGKSVGFITYAKDGDTCEIVALYCAVERQGIGTKLIDQVKEKAKKHGCIAVWLMTTNDNTQALRFYQKRGFVITAIRTNVIEEQRKVQPIPLTGSDGIPIRDEIELEIRL